MVIYNERWEDLTLTNLRDWSAGDWQILGRSWFGDEADFCPIDRWETTCDNAGESVTVKARSMAVLISDND